MASLAHLDVEKEAIAVVGNLQQKGSVVLAASPLMKEKFSIKTGSRLYEIPKHPDIHLFEPMMEYFVRMSVEITNLLSSYVPKESILVYSIDESVVDLTGTERLWGDPEETARQIKDEIYRLFDIPSTVGMGPNMLLAKVALDIEAKKSKTGIAKWTYQDVETKLWPIAPLSKMWGIGQRLENQLNDMGIFTIGDLANYDLSILEKRFGIMGNQLYYHAWGIDLSTVNEASLIHKQESYGKSQILMRDYHTKNDVFTILLETCEEVARRAREAYKVGRTITLSISYSKHSSGGFQRSLTIEEPTNETLTIYQVCQQLFNKYYDGRPVRQIGVSISKLASEHFVQLSLFDDNKWKQRKLGATVDALRSRFGSTAVLRAISYTNAGTALKRAQLLGGHKK